MANEPLDQILSKTTKGLSQKSQVAKETLNSVLGFGGFGRFDVRPLQDNPLQTPNRFGYLEVTHRPLSSSFLGLPYRILKLNHKNGTTSGLRVWARMIWPIRQEPNWGSTHVKIPEAAVVTRCSRTQRVQRCYHSGITPHKTTLIMALGNLSS